MWVLVENKQREPWCTRERDQPSMEKNWPGGQWDLMLPSFSGNSTITSRVLWIFFYASERGTGVEKLSEKRETKEAVKIWTRDNYNQREDRNGDWDEMGLRQGNSIEQINQVNWDWRRVQLTSGVVQNLMMRGSTQKRITRITTRAQLNPQTITSPTQYY